MQRPDLLTDPRFEIHRDRRQNYEALHQIVGDWIATLTLDQVQTALDKHGVPATKVYATSDIMSDEHYAAPRADRRRALRAARRPAPTRNRPPRLSKTPGGVKHRAPTLGEHNRENLRRGCSASAMMHSNNSQRTE